jgi:hypothetical protein
MAQTLAQKEYGLKGPVKSVLNEATEVSQQTGAITRTTKGSCGFDSEGRLTEEVQFHYSSGELFRRITHEYAPDGKEHETTFMPDGSVAEKLVFEYRRDAEGRVIETKVFKGDGSLRNTSVNSYDSQGRFSGGSSFNPNGSLVNRTVMVYDEKNKLREFTVYNSAGVAIQRDVQDGDIHDFTQDHWDGMFMRRSQSKSAVEEIDFYGNWTRRKIAATRTLRGKRQEVFVVINRIITYY